MGETSPTKSIREWIPVGALLAGMVLASGCVSSIDTIADSSNLQTTGDNVQTADGSLVNGDTSAITSAQFVPTKSPVKHSAESKIAVVADQGEDIKPAQSSNTVAVSTAETPELAQAATSPAVREVQTAASPKPKKPAIVKSKAQPTEQELALARIYTANDVAKSRVKRPNLFSRSKIAKQARARNRTKRVKPEVLVATRGNSALPGVKKRSKLFGINETKPESNIQVAGVGSFGRLSPNGLRLQHSKVQVHCFKPELLKILKIVERRYKQRPIVTSGYRSPSRNRRAGGASRSQHIYCKAADIQLEGVSKWDLAKFLRSIPGRGGVGTYCRTKSVHVDVGPKRDWHHPCRRSHARRKRA